MENDLLLYHKQRSVKSLKKIPNVMWSPGEHTYINKSHCIKLRFTSNSYLGYADFKDRLPDDIVKLFCIGDVEPRA